VTESSAPFAAGVHLPWAEVPASVRQWAGALRDGGIEGTADLPGGFSPGATTRLSFRSGDLFVKAVGLDLNQESPVFHRREIEISGILPPHRVFPRLVDTYDDGDWVALAFEAVDGRMPRHPWDPAELAACVAAVAAMHEALTPPPGPTIETTATRFGDAFGGWARLASGPVPAVLDDWSRRHLDRLAALEVGWPAASVGGTLVHGDLRADNMLLTADGAVVVDWPHASIGTPIFDLVCWAPSVALERGPLPEELMARRPAWAQADPDVVATLVAAVAGYMVQHSLEPTPPGLPTLRPFQAAQGEVACAWLARLTGWA
jgi:hypothetical protein